MDSTVLRVMCVCSNGVLTIQHTIAVLHSQRQRHNNEQNLEPIFVCARWQDNGCHLVAKIICIEYGEM